MAQHPFYRENIRRRGMFGEAVCTHVLQKKGYKIIKRNYKVIGGEVDIICSKEQYLVFVEVKTWARFGIVDIMYSITPFKLLRLRDCAKIFIERSDVEKHTRMCVRFDVMFFNITQQTLIHYKGVE